ncbi:MAG: hypothetical protein ABIR66_08995, partial [Saprospiraceae bacterium]
MKKHSALRLFIPIIAFILLFGCRPQKPTSTVTSAEEDTRVLVKRAFDSADRKVVKSILNTERAAMLKFQLEKEKDPTKQLNLTLDYANELLKSGNAELSTTLYQKILDFVTENKLPLDSATKRNLLSSVGIAFMRLGETQNCVQNHNHQSCYIPIKGEGIHQLPAGSRGAIKIYEQMLKEFPKDLETKYLLNLAYMTLGEYPDKVPAAYRINPSWYKSKVNIQPFKDIAMSLGLN